MQAERRAGLRKFIPFLREKRNTFLETPKEEIKDGDLNVPANAYKDGTAEVSVTTRRTNGEWITTVAFSGTVIGLKKTGEGSMIEALANETEFMDGKTDVVKFDPIPFDYGNLPFEKRIELKDYSQRRYTVRRKAS